MKLLSMPLVLVACAAATHTSIAQINNNALNRLAQSEQSETAKPASMNTASPRLGVDTNNFDTSVRPQDNFYQSINGSWLQNTEIPADKSNYGAFTELADKAEADQRAIIEEAAHKYLDIGNRTTVPAGGPQAKAAQQSPEFAKIGRFYASFMNVKRIEHLGLQPLQEKLKAIQALRSAENIVSYIGANQRIGVAKPVAYYINQDARHSTEYIGYLAQNGLGLPDRDYYLEESERFKSVRAKYVEYIETLLGFAGEADAKAKAARIVALETRFAEASWTNIQNRDREKKYNKFTIENVQKFMPDFAWLSFLDAAGVADSERIIVSQPSYMQAVVVALRDVPISGWQAYFKFHLLDEYAPYLNAEFVATHFDFHGKTLSGTEENRPRWKRGVRVVNAAMGEAVGKIYVKRHFSSAAKARMDELVANLSKAFAISIDRLDWMSAETKKEAHDKLALFTPKIGYPKKWKNYSTLPVDENDLVGNILRSNALEYRRMVSKLGKPVDRDEWFMTPPTVTAYYNPSMNEVVFPAAILQPPFFNIDADDAVNYGAIGAVIGHEFSHGFDDQGSKSDGMGDLRDWWTASDKEEFKKRAQGLIAQYDAYTPLDNAHVKGELTLGENIADLAGLTMAHRAYKLSLDGILPPMIDGFSGDQRFFMGWAQVWRRKYREEELRKRLLTDPHAPSEYRVNGVLPNMPQFYEAYNLKEEDGMYMLPDKRLSIW
ncbi:MAG: M13 family metallopeptidase [Pseudomonadales bacterium]